MGDLECMDNILSFKSQKLYVFNFSLSFYYNGFTLQDIASYNGNFSAAIGAIAIIISTTDAFPVDLAA